MKPKHLLALLTALVLPAAPAHAATDTFTNESALAWSTTGSPASSKTVHFVGANTGVEFDLTLATSAGNLVTGNYHPGGGDYLADSGGINGADWFEGTLTLTVNNFTGAALGDITFQLLDVSGQCLLTNAINLTSAATPTTTAIALGNPPPDDRPFSNIALDATAANMAGGQYVATLAWKNMDAESSGLYRYLSFEVSTSGAPDNTPPSPNPATFAVAPAADSSTAISMTATTGTDASAPVQYLFTETSGNPGATSSAWQTSPSYTDTGLQPSTQYTYTVTMRDSLGNTGTASTAASATTQAPQSFDTFTDQSTLQWDTVNTSSSKTVHVVGPNTGVEFDLTLATSAGSLVTGDYTPGGVSYLSDSGGINGFGWFEGVLTVTASNFTGAALGDIGFQLLDVSGRRLATDTINFTSIATPATTPILLGTPWNTDAAFSNIALDATAANMAGGQYVATLAWKNMDEESSGLYRYLSYKVTVAGATGPVAPRITSFTPVGGNVWELDTAGSPNTAFQFRSSTTLQFNPGALVENLTQGNPGVDPGTISGTNNSVLATDANGDAKVRLALTGNPADFVRAQSIP